MQNNDLRIVLFDLETLPNLPAALTYWKELDKFPGKTFKANINSIICAGWKVYGQKHVHCINAWDFPSWKRNVNDDKEVCKAIYEVLSEADVVVSYNGKRFDEKFLNIRLLINGFPPLPPFLHIDCCAVARSKLMFINNRLNTIAVELTDLEKEDTGGWGLWEDVHDRIESSMRKMEEYCKGDVLVLESVFEVLKPFVKLPNANMFRRDGSVCCPNCGGFNLQERGRRVAKEKVYVRFHCQDCGTWARETVKDKAPRS